jgi:hypothetical protein
LAKGARILSNPKLRDAAWRQVGWILGNNPLNASTVCGVGQGQPRIYKEELAPYNDGVLIMGISGGSNDRPYMRGGHWRWAEMDIAHTVWFGRAVFELLSQTNPLSPLSDPANGDLKKNKGGKYFKEQ